MDTMSLGPKLVHSPASTVGLPLADAGARSAARVPPALTDRFEALRTLGAGGCGVVMLVRDRRLDREVALKLLHTVSREQVALFDQEARILAGLEHEHIVRIYDCGVADGAPYLVMEYVRGATLSARLA